MITLHGSPNSISFTPRPGFRRKAVAVNYDLIYGHVCPVCSNVIQAFFYTKEKISLWPYEETTVLSQGQNNMGEVLKVVPDEKYNQDESCYRSYFYQVASGKNGQKIVLKNHLMQPGLIDNVGHSQTRENLWEVGERTCPQAGVFSSREDLIVKDAGLLLDRSMEELNSYNLPSIQTLIPDSGGDISRKNFRLIPAVGSAPPILLVSRDTINATHSYWLMKLLEPFQKAI